MEVWESGRPHFATYSVWRLPFSFIRAAASWTDSPGLGGRSMESHPSRPGLHGEVGVHLHGRRRWLRSRTGGCAGSFIGGCSSRRRDVRYPKLRKLVDCRKASLWHLASGVPLCKWPPQSNRHRGTTGALLNGRAF